MEKNIRPTIFITFDEYWQDNIKLTVEDISNSYYPVDAVTEGLVFKKNGLYDLFTDEILIGIDGLLENYDVESWKTNHELISNSAENIQRALFNFNTNIYAADNISKLSQLDVTASKEISLFMISSTHHPVGSPSVPIFLDAIYSMFINYDPDKSHKVILLLISPDIYGIDDKSQLYVARSCRLLEELEIMYNRFYVDSETQNALFDIAWLFSKTNTKSTAIKDISDIAAQVSIYFKLWITNSFPRDESYLRPLFIPNTKRRLRMYCGMGASSIVLPSDAIIAKLRNEVHKMYKEQLLFKYQLQHDEHVLQQSKQAFIKSLRFDGVSDSLAQYDSEDKFNKQIISDASVMEQMNEYEIQELLRTFNDEQENKLYRKYDYLRRAEEKIKDEYIKKINSYIIDCIERQDCDISVCKDIFSSIEEDYNRDLDDESRMFSQASYLMDIAYRYSMKLFDMHDEREMIESLRLQKNDIDAILDNLSKEVNELDIKIKELSDNNKDGDKESVVESSMISNLKADRKSKRTQIKNIKSEAKQIAEELNNKNKAIHNIKALLKNKDQREELLHNKIESLKDSANKLVFSLADKINAIKYIRDEIGDYDHIFRRKRLTTIISSSILVMGVVLLLTQNMSFYLYYLIAIAVIIFGGAILWLALYLIYAGKIRACEDKRKAIVNELHDAIRRISKYRNEEYRLRYNNAICLCIYDLDNSFKQYLHSKISSISNFIGFLNDEIDLEEVSIYSSSPFNASALSDSDYENIKSDLLAAINDKLLNNCNNLSKYWQLHEEESNDAVNRRILKDIEGCIISSIPEIHKGDIEGYFESIENTEGVRKIFNTINNELCHPFISAQPIQSKDNVYDYDWIFTASGKADSINRFIDINKPTEIKKGYLSNEVSFIKLKMGISVSELSIMKKREGIHDLDKLSAEVICNDKYSAEIAKIGNFEKILEKVLEIFLLAEIFEVILKIPNGYSFEEWQYIGDKNEAIEAIEIDNALLERIHLKVEERTKKEDASKMLEASLIHNSYSDIEKEIIKKAIKRLASFT